MCAEHAELQWGRAKNRAERLKGWTPPGCTKPLLQWGRAKNRAESGVRGVVEGAVRDGFNGAARKIARKV